MIQVLQAIILGIIQGLGEFLPISSSGHLVLAHELGIDLGDNDLAFDVALHFGTLAALIVYFWPDLYSYSRRFLYKISLLFDQKKGRAAWFVRAKEFKIFVLIVLATIPGALAGLFLQNWVEIYTRNSFLVGGTLMFYGVLLMVADAYSEKKFAGAKDRKAESSNHKGIGSIPVWKAFLIGVSQALAVIPGTSRSGITITSALFLGLKRAEAARFSFILSIPIVAGASLIKLPQLFDGSVDIAPLLLSIIVSFSVGFLAIKYLLKYVSTNNFQGFGYYRIFLALLIFLIGFFVM
ncbi:MAG: UDP-diphosphatase [Candidatus Moranbacteria bacterium]|nr:UDP-diphosphatase [Candidatus Moranbacteria bacterium]